MNRSRESFLERVGGGITIFKSSERRKPQSCFWPQTFSNVDLSRWQLHVLLVLSPHWTTSLPLPHWVDFCSWGGCPLSIFNSVGQGISCQYLVLWKLKTKVRMCSLGLFNGPPTSAGRIGGGKEGTVVTGPSAFDSPENVWLQCPMELITSAGFSEWLEDCKVT